MSRGLGKTQRELLDELKQNPGGIAVTLPWMSDSQKTSRRRAAKSLEDQGLAELATGNLNGKDRLALFPIGTNAPQGIIRGLDGKAYRTADDTGQEQLSLRAVASVLGVSPTTAWRDRQQS